MTDSRPGGSSPEENQPYQGYSDPAYASGWSPDPGYSGAPPPGRNPTEPLPPYWTQTSGQSVPGGAPPEPPPPRRGGPPAWLWIAAGFAIALVIGLVIWTVWPTPSSNNQAISAPSSTTIRTTAPTTRTSSSPLFPIPSITLPGPSSTNPSGETEPVVYEVTGEGRALTINYVDTGSVMQVEFLVSLPWRKEVNLPKPAKDSASLSVTNASADITCRVSVAGVQVKTNTGSVFVSCLGSG